MRRLLLGFVASFLSIHRYPSLVRKSWAYQQVVLYAFLLRPVCMASSAVNLLESLEVCVEGDVRDC
jgi:hypothetical protein